MRLLRFGPPNFEKPGIIDSENKIRDLSSITDDINAQSISEALLANIAKTDLSALPLVDPNERIGPCIGKPGKLICIGLNYSDHAREANMQVPSEPVVFMKATSALCGANDPVEIPRNSQKTDWEVELGIVIGKRAKYILHDEAATHIAGYCLVNDLSERSFQFEHEGQWVKGKSHDSFAPIGPWLVTSDEIADPQNLSLWTDVNGQRYQDGSTQNMVFGVYEIIAYLSQFMTLEPGDIISTGTPTGVGMGLKPPIYLRTGDKISVGISGLGEQHKRCVAAD